jgi:hypothetical protein
MLRGRAGIFASEKVKDERWLAEHAAQLIPEELLSHRRQCSELAETLRLRLGADRRREAIAVPGLTAEALAAIDRLEQAGAGKVPISKDTAGDRLAASEIALAARVAPVWAAIQADPLLRDELAAFRKAANARLGDYPDLLAHPGVFKVLGLSGVLTQAEELAERHAAVEAAQAAREQAEMERRNAARAAEEAWQRSAAKAGLERKLRALRPDTLRPPRQRPRDHAVRTDLEKPKPQASSPPPVAPEVLALRARGRDVVKRWGALERAEAKTRAAQNWRDWGTAWDGLIALGRAIKRDGPLDDMLRRHGDELGVRQTSHLGLVLQGTEAEIVWALTQKLGADARSSPSPSHSPSPSFGP